MRRDMNKLYCWVFRCRIASLRAGENWTGFPCLIFNNSLFALQLIRSWHSFVNIALWSLTERSEDQRTIQTESRDFSPRHASRLALLLTHGYGRLFPWRYSGRGLKLTIHCHVLYRSRIHGTIPPLPHTSSWHTGTTVLLAFAMQPSIIATFGPPCGCE
jgi:hypothetical protein